MAKITPATSITLKRVESARAAAARGEEGEIKDAGCPGLSLRLRAGRVTWTLRWKVADPVKAARASAIESAARLAANPVDLEPRAHKRLTRYRRWTIGDDKVPPEKARERAVIVKATCRAGGDPSRQITGWLTGVSVGLQLERERGPASVPWEKAVQIFLDYTFERRADATYEDYRNIVAIHRN